MSSQYPGRSGSTSDDCEPGFSSKTSSQLRRAREAINILSSLGGKYLNEQGYFSVIIFVLLGNIQSVQGNDATNSRTSSTHGGIVRCVVFAIIII